MRQIAEWVMCSFLKYKIIDNEKVSSAFQRTDREICPKIFGES